MTPPYENIPPNYNLARLLSKADKHKTKNRVFL